MRVALLPSQNRDIWSLACSSGLPTLHHWCQKSLSQNQCKLYQRDAQQPRNSTRHCSQQMDHWHQALPVQVVHVPGCLNTGLDSFSCCAVSPNNPIEEYEDTNDWLDRTMSFAFVLMNSQPSW